MDVMPSREDMQKEADEAKPIPKPNLEAKTPAEVYPLELLVGSVALRNLGVQDWIDQVEAEEEIITKSKFVSGRLARVVKTGDVKLVKALKYLLLLLEWYLCFKATHNGFKKSRKVPHTEDVVKEIGWASNDLVEELPERFAEGTYVVPHPGVIPPIHPLYILSFNSPPQTPGIC
jgi:DNA-directed RNA polymerase I subunit RPA49